MQRDSARLDSLDRIVEIALRIENVAEHREIAGASEITRGCAEIREQAVPALRVAIVPDIIAGQAEEDAVRWDELNTPARSDNILVVVPQPVGEILAKAAAADPRRGNADEQPLRQRCRRRHDQVRLAVGAEIGADAHMRPIGRNPLRHIFDRAADRIAAVERALRATQNLDPLDVVDVEHRSLRSVEIDVVDVNADALLEAGDRVLLADAANERREGAVGAAADLEGHVWRGLGNVSDVQCALAVELLARISRNRHRNVQQHFVAATCSDNDGLVASGCCLRLRLRIFRGGWSRIGTWLGGSGAGRSREERRGGNRAEPGGACRSNAHECFSPFGRAVAPAV